LQKVLKLIKQGSKKLLRKRRKALNQRDKII